MVESEYRKHKIVTKWAEIGDDALEGARACRSARRWRSCISRSYYAAYSFAASLLAKEGVAFREDRVGPEHEPLPDLVRDHLKRRLSRPAIKELRATLGALYEARLTADYQPHQPVNEATARIAEQNATRVRKLMERELS